MMRAFDYRQVPGMKNFPPITDAILDWKLLKTWLTVGDWKPKMAAEKNESRCIFWSNVGAARKLFPHRSQKKITHCLSLFSIFSPNVRVSNQLAFRVSRAATDDY